MEEKKVKKTKEHDGYPIYYARFHQAVPPGLDKEPVNEFRIKSATKQIKQGDLKYLVDSLKWTPEGIVYQAYGETGLVALANVVYCRLTL